MRRIIGVVVSEALLHPPVGGVIEQRRSQEMQRGLRLRLIDILTFTGTPTIVERRQH
jgi:hypothetical protein